MSTSEDEYDLTGVIREYHDQAEALGHLMALQAAGIAAVLTGDVPNGATFHWLVGRMNYAPIQLVVPTAKREEAERVLLHLDEPLEEGWEAAAESAIEGWVCLNCDTVVKQDEPACPTCGTLRSEQPQEDDEDE